MILITGGAGFIGSNFALNWLEPANAEALVNLDKLTYAGNLANLHDLQNDPRHIFVQGDIGNMLIAQFTILQNLYKPIYWALLIYWSVHVSIGLAFRALKRNNFAFIMYQRMKSMDLYPLRIRPLRRPIHTSPIVLMQPLKRLPTTWSVHGFILMDFQL